MVDRSKRDQWNEWLEEFQGESDRACAILGAAMLDEQLRSLLEAFLVDDTKCMRELFEGASAPLSSFSGRILMAYAAGFIAPSELQDFTLIRKIRNEFAHNLHGVSFSTEAVANRCYELAGPRMYEQFLGEIGARNRYVLSVNSLANWIAIRRLRSQRERRTAQQEVGRPSQLEFDG